MHPRPFKILCVDDDPSTLEVRKLLLGGAGYSVLTTPSAADALQILGQEPDIDLVLLDYVMPGMNGDELARQLRERYPRLRLVAVSAIGQLPPKLLNNVDSHIQKGQEPEVLLSVIAAVLGRSALLRTSDQLRTVLCVEDEDLQLHLRKMQFESAGFHVLQAQSAGAAMEVFRSQHVDAVVMDYWLSGKNGTAVAEEMKQLSPRIPIIMLSGFSSLPGEGAVVDAWLRKVDVEPEDLVNEVRRLIDRSTGAQPATTS